MNRSAIESLLAKLVSELDNDNTLGLMLVGSYAYGTATEHSDIDITRFIQSPESAPSHRLDPYDGQMLSLLISTLPQDLFTNPLTALWAVPMWRSAQILLDKKGQLATLQAEAQAFRWEQIEDTAHRYVSFALYRKTEDINKLVSALEINDLYCAALSSGWILQWMAEAVAIRYGAFLTSERAIYPIARSALGTESKWSHLLDQALGITIADQDSIQSRGIATLRLYCETATLMHNLIQSEHRLLIEMAVNAACKFRMD
jgi:hypothetical protein